MDLLRVYTRLRQALGHEDWWWAEGDPWEMMVGALLTQQTTWQSVDRALRSLKAEDLLAPEAMAVAPRARIEACIRPTGFYRTKARRLRKMAAHVLRGAGSVEAFLTRPPEELRRSLLALEGVGEETADAILLYAAGHATPVVDAYTRRILSRLGTPLPAPYEDAARQLRRQLPDRVADHQRFHALMVELGKAYCRSAPRCAPCPLLDLCPHGQATVGHPTRAGL
ncbi:MAG: endonuclease III domain-containing protein [Thermoplasmata archaeon]